MKNVTEVEPDYETGEQVDLVLPDDPFAGTYSTEVSEVEWQTLAVEVPQVNGLYLPVGTDTSVVLKQYSDSATLEAETSIDARPESEEPPLLKLTKPDSARRIQRRDFVRVPCEIEVIVYLIQPGGDAEDLPKKMDGEIEDISAGGVQLLLDHSLPLFTEVELVFTLPNTSKTLREVFGQIVRVSENEEPPHIHGLEFKSITENKRNDIVQFVYKKQRELKN